jgi:UDP-N-acetylglucosamine 4,6-dehydratase
MRAVYPEYPDNKMRYILGDIQDYDHLMRVIPGHDTVIHAAAMKYIDRSEYNALECLRNNIDGTRSVALACSQCRVQRAMFVSSDKACDPISLYGMSKGIGERIWTAANNLSPVCRFTSVRYGNVHMSNGSVFHKWRLAKDEGRKIQLTDSRMTRYFWTVKQAAKFLLTCLANDNRGCVYVSKMLSYRMEPIARSYGEIEYTGLRCLEKIHEDLISEHESGTCYDHGDYYCIYPAVHDWINNLPIQGTKVPEGFALKSSDNPKEEL